MLRGHEACHEARSEEEPSECFARRLTPHTSRRRSMSASRARSVVTRERAHDEERRGGPCDGEDAVHGEEVKRAEHLRRHGDACGREDLREARATEGRASSPVRGPCRRESAGDPRGSRDDSHVTAWRDPRERATAAMSSSTGELARAFLARASRRSSRPHRSPWRRRCSARFTSSP